VSSRGASGGIKILWKRINFEQAQTQTQFWIRVNLLNKISGMLYSIINVYIPNHYNEKIECWQSLIDLAKENPPQNLIIAGDFNTTRAAMEKRGGSVVRDQFQERLEDLISDLDLYDVPSNKGIYTWNNRRAGPGHIAARLDRFLISSELLALCDKSC
jgi:endonuclease/exonuclease/phosphatase family metal-dependent hydrolase